MSHLGATRLRRELDGQNKLAVWVADKVDDSHVRGDLLLLGDKKDCEVILAESLLDGGKIELIHGSASVSPQADAEGVEVLLFGSIDQSNPGSRGIHLRHTGPVDNAARLAVDSAMALLIAEFAGTIESTLYPLVGTICLVVTDLTAVEALASKTATALGLIRAVAGEVTGLLAAILLSAT